MLPARRGGPFSGDVEPSASAAGRSARPADRAGAGARRPPGVARGGRSAPAVRRRRRRAGRGGRGPAPARRRPRRAGPARRRRRPRLGRPARRRRLALSARWARPSARPRRSARAGSAGPARRRPGRGSSTPVTATGASGYSTGGHRRWARRGPPRRVASGGPSRGTSRATWSLGLAAAAAAPERHLRRRRAVHGPSRRAGVHGCGGEGRIRAARLRPARVASVGPGGLESGRGGSAYVAVLAYAGARLAAPASAERTSWRNAGAHPRGRRWP